MTQTATQSKIGVRANQAVGRFIDTGTVTATTFTVGFKPRVVRIINNTSGDEMTWMEGMADDSGFKRLAAGTATAVASHGITVSEHAFVLGTDTDILVSSEQLSWEARG